jgi:hypothetical protein
MPRRSVWVTIPFLLVGCDHMMGETFVDQDMRDPKTGSTVTCVGHIGRGEPTKAQMDTMNACVSWYLSQGFVKVK